MALKPQQSIVLNTLQSVEYQSSYGLSLEGWQ